MSKPKRPRGRPRKPENTALIAALIQRQDAMAHRAARKIRELLDTHVSMYLCELEVARMRSIVRQELSRLPDACLARLPAVAEPDRLRSLLATEIEAATAILGEGEAPTDEEYEAANRAAAADPVRRRPRVSRSHTLAAARAQSARLHSQLIALRERIVPMPPGWPTRHRETGD